MSTEQELIKQLEDCREAEIVGVVSASGVGAVGTGGPRKRARWTALITLTGWRLVGEEMRKSEMVVRKEMSDRELRVLQGSMDAYDVVRIRARFTEHSVFGTPQALLSRFIGRDRSDSELNAYALKLQELVTFLDPQFGLLTLDRRLDWYEATPEWCGNAIRLWIPAKPADAVEKSLGVARRLWTEQEEWQRRITAFAIAELLALKNDTWLDEGEAEIGEADFARRMVLESVSVKEDGTFEFWHNDGELFWGHSIMVSGNLADGPTDAGIHG